VKKRVKIVEIRVMLKLVLILALFVAALSAPLGEVPRRPNPLAIHRTRGFYEGLLEFWTSGQEMEFWSRMSDKRIRVTQALEQDKTDKSDTFDLGAPKSEEMEVVDAGLALLLAGVVANETPVEKGATETVDIEPDPNIEGVADVAGLDVVN